MRLVPLMLAFVAILLLLASGARGESAPPDLLPPAEPLPRFEPEPRETGLRDGNEIETDRDSFTPASTTAGYRRLIVESAWSFIDNRSVPDTNSLPELIGRYGVTDWLELRMGCNYEAGGTPNFISGDIDDVVPEEIGGIERDTLIFYGFKAGLSQQQEGNWIPQSALLVEAGTPVTGRDTDTQLFATYVFGWELPNQWKWDSAMRYGYDAAAGDHFNLWAPSSVVRIPVGERWIVHAEYFGIFSQGQAGGFSQNYFSPGLHYLLNSNLETGLRLGWGLNSKAANFFTNVGFGWRY